MAAAERRENYLSWTLIEKRAKGRTEPGHPDQSAKRAALHFTQFYSIPIPPTFNLPVLLSTLHGDDKFLQQSPLCCASRQQPLLAASVLYDLSGAPLLAT